MSLITLTSRITKPEAAKPGALAGAATALSAALAPPVSKFP
jgi:hypothetical protein